MKITKVQTQAFTIPEDIEEKILKSAQGSVTKRYAPLGVFKVLRTEEVKKGVFFKTTSFDRRENNFYVDLSHCDLYYTKRGSIFKDPKLVKDGLVRQIIDYKDVIITTLGQLYEYGSIPYDQLDREVVAELKNEGFIETYERESSQMFNFLRYYLEDDIIMHRYYVRLGFHLPVFSNLRYDIGAALHTSDMGDDDYIKDPIQFNHDRVAEVLGQFFGGKVILKGLVYLPYAIIEHKGGEGPATEIKYLACPKGYKRLKTGFPSEVKLEPISFSTEMGAGGSVPIEASTINFSHVADLKEVKEKIREAIIYPLQHVEVSKKYEKKGGGRILFYGPPGCGKTYIARATVGECGLNFFNINTSDIISGGDEAGAKNIHEVFSTASKSAPCILFFDEIDALAERRDSAGSSSRVIVNQFLMEMDGVENYSENVLILGSTNVPWDLDPALRRPGRFADLIFIPPPNYLTRLEIFKLNTKKRPVSSKVDLEKLGELTEGYSSADIKAVCDDALEIPWAEALKGAPARKATMNDFLIVLGVRPSSLTAWYKQAEKQIRKSGEVELFADLSRQILRHAGGVDQEVKPKLRFIDVANMEDVKDKVTNSIINPLVKPEIARKYKKKVGGGAILYGPPGCGKTYIARATAGECDATFFNIKVTDILSSEIGDPEKNLKYVFERAYQNTPAIVFFDEIDALAPRRESAGISRTLVNQFLSELDGFKDREGVMVLASTNTPWDVDPALRRAGRLTDQIYVPPPGKDVREKIFEIHTRDRPISSNVDFKQLSKLTEGYSSADIKAVCDDAIDKPWAEALSGTTARKANQKDFISAIEERNSSLPPWFKLALTQINESGEAEVFSNMLEDIMKYAGGIEAAIKPKLKFKDVADLSSTKEKIKRTIVYPLTKPKLSAKYSRDVGGGILFYGPPGCGKTYLARATAGECNATFFNVKITDILSEEVGESERRLNAIFERAVRNTPSIIFFDEIDAIAPRREAAGKSRTLVNQFLTELDGFKDRDGVMVLASTNAPWAVDPALRRAGRFTEQVFVSAPDAETRSEILSLHTQGKQVETGLDFKKLSGFMEGFSSADVKTCVDLALERPWAEALSGKPERKVDFSDFMEVINTRSSTLPAWYRLAEKQLEQSGEKDLYTELWDVIGKQVPKEQTKRQVASGLEYEIREVSEQIKLLKRKIKSGKIDEDIGVPLLRDLHGKLLKLEAKRND